MSRPRSPGNRSGVRGAALDYATRGWLVLPIRSGKKVPATAHGVKDATREAAQIRRWPAGAGVGIAGGGPARLVVLDIDMPNGAKSLAALERELGPLPRGPRARTPRGGEHLYFAFPADLDIARVTNTAGKLATNIDVRACGGYVVAPPTPGYEWSEQHTGALPLLPSAWAERLLNIGRGPRHAYAKAALRHAADAVSRAPDGVRNDTLNREAYSLGGLVVSGELDERAIETGLLGAARAAGLPDGEARATFRNGIHAGKLAPRSGSQAPRTIVTAAQASFSRGDHVEIADRLLEALSARGRVVYADGALHGYDPDRGVFARITPAGQSRTIQDFAGARVGDDKVLRVKRADVAGAMQLAWDRVADPTFFAAAGDGCAFDNGFVRVSGDGVRLMRHAPEHRARWAYPFAYTPGAMPARFIRFLEDVFRDDFDADAKRLLVQEYLGASLLGVAARYQRALVLYGQGANGKSVLSSIATRAMPPDSTCAIPPQDWGNEYRAALLAGRRLNVVAELPEANIMTSERFKAIITGDATTARQIRQPPFTFRACAGHVFSANRLPGTEDHTHGFWRRLLIMKFNREFRPDEQNPRLADEIIAAELPAIVSWLLAGAVRVLLHRGFTEPPSSAGALAEWRRDADQVGAFVAECTEKLEASAPFSQGESAEFLCRQYRAWADRTGHRALAMNKFGTRLVALGVERKHTNSGTRYACRFRLPTVR